MPLLKPPAATVAKCKYYIRIEEPLALTMERYAEFIGTHSADHVITQALEFVFKKDSEFSQWLETFLAAGLYQPGEVHHLAPQGRLRLCDRLGTNHGIPLVSLVLGSGHQPHCFAAGLSWSVPLSCSWVALIPDAGFVLVILRRTQLEDEFLKENLPGYVDYARRFPARPVPFRRPTGRSHARDFA
jgi:hypothetical protein